MTHTMRLMTVAIFAGGILMIGCPGPEWPKCEKDDHCKADKEGNSAKRDLICVFGQCQECAQDEHCAAGKVCRSYRCVDRPECMTDAECGGNKICRNGTCAVECSGDADCGGSRICQDNRCRAKTECAEDADCAEGKSCVGGMCQSDSGDLGSDTGADNCEIEPRVFFNFNESSITPEARAILDESARCLKLKPALRITIEGHCDERGTAEYNLALGEQRAASTRKYLQNLGIDRNRIKIISYGEEQPLDPSATESGWARNRRAEFSK